MKTNFTLLALLLVLTSTIFAQTIRRVNNNPGVTGTNIYATIQAAHDAAVAGDIIYVEPSVNAYGDLTSTKNLTIYGPGYFLPINQELSATKLDAAVGFINLNAGSAGTTIQGGITFSSINIYVSNVTVRRSKGTGIYIYAPNNSSLTNILIEQNYAYVVQVYGYNSTYIVSNVIVQNNSQPGVTTYGGLRLISNQQTSNLIFRNNTAWDVGGTLYNALFENNILNRSDSPNNNHNFVSCTVQNNVATGTLPAGNGNQSNVVVDNEFEYAPTSVLPSNTLPAGVSPDEASRLKSGSTLKTAGTGGSEVGAFGGSVPYVISGIPSVPSIPNLYVTPTGNSTTPLSVTITTKSNN